jgi:hypothetical protein
MSDNILTRINAHIKALRLGECACVSKLEGGRLLANLYLLPDFRDSSLVASWIHGMGGAKVEIEHTLYSDDDEARGGLMHGCQAWQVSFVLADATTETP